MNATTQRRALVLFAHGARAASWAAPFERLRDITQARLPDCEVTLAFLEFMSPDIGTAGDQLAAQGCTEVTVVPLFLGAGGHVRKDLPRLIGELAQRHPQVNWRLSPAVGETDILIQGMADAAWSLAQPPADTTAP